MAPLDVMTTLPFSARGERLLGQEMFKVMERAQALERHGLKVYHLELGNPRMAPPAEILDATIAAIRHKQLGYTPMAGLPALRSALADRYESRIGRRLSPQQVVISPANLLISQFLDLTCDRGERVVIFTPAFPSYLAAIQHIGLDPIPVVLDRDGDFQLTEDHIEEALACRPRAVIINSGNNPTGAVYSQSILQQLAQRCDNERVWLLSDETYGDLAFGRPFYSLASIPASHVVTIGSFSKIFSIPGYRTGYAIAHPTVAEKLALSCSTLMSCLPAFTQVGCLAGLRVVDEYVAGVRARCRRMAERCARLVNRSSALSCRLPESGFYLFVDVSRTSVEDVTFCQRLLEEHQTAVTPGRSFGAPWRSHIRVAMCGDEDDVLEGLMRLIRFAEDLKENHGTV